MSCQPVTRGQDQAFLLRRRDARRRPAKVAPGATAYLDKYGRRSVVADEIDLAALDAKIARQHPQTLCQQVTRGGFFAGIAQLFGA